MPKILAIDDEQNMLELIRAFLSMDKHTIELAHNGTEGLEKAKTFEPDLILCDVMMPDMDGYTVLEKVQSIDALKNVPFIFLTGLGDMEHLRQGMNSGADDYLTKPFTYKDISQAISTRLNKRSEITEKIKTEVSQDYDEKLAAADQKLQKALFSDDLTGLANLKQLEADFGEFIGKHAQVALLAGSVDQWETFAESNPDALRRVLLKVMGNRFKSTFETHQVYASDTDFYLLAGSDAASDYQGLAQRFMSCFNEPFDIMNREINFTSSVGIARYPEQGNLLTDLMRSARQARQQAVNAGGNQIRFAD